MHLGLGAFKRITGPRPVLLFSVVAVKVAYLMLGLVQSVPNVMRLFSIPNTAPPACSTDFWYLSCDMTERASKVHFYWVYEATRTNIEPS